MRLLIVDDDPGIRAMLTGFAKTEGWDADAVGSAVEAVRAIARNDYHLITLDLHLGSGLSGNALIRAIRGASGLAPMLVVSGSPNHLRDLGPAGADGVIRKGATNTALAFVSALREVAASVREDRDADISGVLVTLRDEDP